MVEETLREGTFTVEKFVEAFPVLVEAAGGTKQLRTMILALSLRGRLSHQSPSDRNAADEVAAAVRDRYWRVEERPPKVKIDPKIEALAGVTPIPSGWVECRLDDCAQLINGRAYAQNELLDAGTPVIRIQNLNGGTDWYYSDLQLPERQYCTKGDLLFAWSASFGPYIWNGVRAIYHYHIWKLNLSKALDKRFFYFSLLHVTDVVREQSHGLAMLHMTKGQMERWPILLPPLAEQKRIVARVDQLMALIDDLEAKQTRKREVGARFTKASLEALTTADGPEEFDRAWKRVVENWETVIDRPEKVGEIRKAVLGLAVRGVLTRQNTADGSARSLLARVAAQKADAGVKTWGGQGAPFEEEGDPPFEIPETWAWMRAEQATQPGRSITYGIIKPVWVEDGVPTVRVTEMKTGVIDVGALPRCIQARANAFKKSSLAPGDLLVSKDGTIGRTAFVPPELSGANITQHVLRFSIHPLLSREYVRLAVDSPFCQSWMKGETKGVALQGVNVGDFQRMPIPLPPLAEQKRVQFPDS